MSAAPEAVRLDKWLWAARFFKTRALASTAIEAGRVPASSPSVCGVGNATKGGYRRGRPRGLLAGTGIRFGSAVQTLVPGSTATA